MRIRKGYEVAAYSRPVLIPSERTSSLKPLCVPRISCAPECPDIKVTGNERLDEKTDLFSRKCISSSVNEYSENGSENTFVEMKKELTGDYTSRKERCIMCGEAGHSCFQQQDVSTRAIPRPFRDRVFEGRAALGMLMRKPDRVEAFKSAQSQRYSSYVVHDKRVGSSHKKELSEKSCHEEAKKKQRTNDAITNEDNTSQTADKRKGNEFERKARKKMKVAGKWTGQRVEAPKRSRQKSALLSSEEVIYDLITDIAYRSDGETRVRDLSRRSKREAAMQINDRYGPTYVDSAGSLTLLSSDMTEISAASCKGCSADFNPLSRTIEPDRRFAARSARNLITYSVGLYNELTTENSQIEDGNIENASSRELQLGAQADSEYRRCKRKDGKGWQCRRKAEAGYSLCEHHLGKFRANHTRKKAAAKIA